MIFTILHYLPTFGLNGFFLNARMAYIDPITNELLPSSPLDDASDNALMEPIPEVKQQDGEPSAMPSDAMPVSDIMGTTPAFYETPIFIGAAIFCLFIAAFLLYLKNRA